MLFGLGVSLLLTGQLMGWAGTRDRFDATAEAFSRAFPDQPLAEGRMREAMRRLRRHAGVDRNAGRLHSRLRVGRPKTSFTIKAIKQDNDARYEILLAGDVRHDPSTYIVRWTRKSGMR